MKFEKLIEAIRKKNKRVIIEEVKKYYSEVVVDTVLSEDGGVNYYCMVGDVEFNIVVYFDDLYVGVWNENDEMEFF